MKNDYIKYAEQNETCIYENISDISLIINKKLRKYKTKMFVKKLNI